ncbi:DUF2017 family protein [Microbacterium esteraromaticum]|uniref:DUF2017 family protein n=1 Tax=Microbacterium esteraromaticum TaxID=57043 RepID=UPI002368606F|nr:DUF2017 family protein [Microbacterium esteraromaticum]WDH80160.1 DUF2017 family protein [Microbacterium esteraromaticum]
MTTDLSLSLATIEVQNLQRLIDEFLDVIADGKVTDDPGLSRIAPAAYADDPAAAAEFRAATRDGLFDRRTADALDVRSDLGAPLEGGSAPSTRAAMRQRTIRIPPEHVDAWLRTLAAVRLVVAARLGIDTADTHEPGDERFHVYDWLGYRLDQLVMLADEHDAG